MDDVLDIAIDADTRALGEALQSREREICAALQVLLAAGAWAPLRLDLARSLLEQVRANWLGWLLEGWGKAAEIVKYGKMPAVASKATASVRIGRHSPSVGFPVDVTITCAGAEFGPIRFDVRIDIALDATILLIREGYIVAIEGGECEASLTVLLGETPLCERLKLTNLKLPGRKDFTPAIPIPGREPPPMLVAEVTGPPAAG